MSSNSVQATAASTLISKATKDISILGYRPSLTKETSHCKHNQKATDWFPRTMSSLKKTSQIGGFEDVRARAQATQVQSGSLMDFQGKSTVGINKNIIKTNQ